MDRYQKVEKPRAETPIDENEIRITSQGRMRNYITYAMSLLQEKGSNEIVFKAMGRAINKTVTIVELIKRRIVGLHQNTAIGSTDITDTWEPLEEGLLPLETTRHVSMITITLSKNELDTSSVGYQPPLPADQVKAATDFDYEGDGSPNGRVRGRGGRGRGRGRGNGFISADYEDGGWDRNRGSVRGRGRGRGRGFRGRGRGGYNGPQFDVQQDGGYNQDVPQGRVLLDILEVIELVSSGSSFTVWTLVVAAAGVDIVEEVVALDQMDQSKQLPEATSWLALVQLQLT
ncbi:hypothetical protein LR48_Vigan07g276100 [Vigna angularis]|uniref:DNA/RNA-binding protein Alba-like domain-containing protein n=1 Tax=Phaseolus angularis TaxID=3914 RepID=A0A0L9V2H8_PHAAN|nr:hypothetical protein LR48_Vigan07g276100 [Vigna angularis]